uniref:NADH dehydrogenase [ubiquinone] iron-sulfur protein 4, mitochondrial n=1 Tax=Strongyloides venezuelensis TaxID=75913 RepID=A0A0K0FY46_STRVS
MRSVLKVNSYFSIVREGRRLCSGKNSSLPSVNKADAVRKSVNDILGEEKKKVNSIRVRDTTSEVIDISGIPTEHQEARTARIFKPAREATQTAWGNTKVWKIELDNRERWENPLMGWSGTADPLSNISMNLDFATADDAIAFCKKNRWTYEVETPQERKIIPKNYGQNFAWNRRTRIMSQSDISSTTATSSTTTNTTVPSTNTNVSPAEEDHTITEEMTIKQMLEENAHLIENLLQYQSNPMESNTIPSMDASLRQLYKNIIFVSRYADQTTQEEASGLQEYKENDTVKL